MIGFATCAALLLERVRPVSLAPVLILLVGLSFARTATWRTEESLMDGCSGEGSRENTPKNPARASRRAIEGSGDARTDRANGPG